LLAVAQREHPPGGPGSSAMLPTPPSFLGWSPSPRPIFAQMPASLLTPEPQPRGAILSSLDGNTVGNIPSQQAPSSQKRESPGEWAVPQTCQLGGGGVTSARPSAPMPTQGHQRSARWGRDFRFQDALLLVSSLRFWAAD
jgi:hypothetical protein